MDLHRAQWRIAIPCTLIVLIVMLGMTLYIPARMRWNALAAGLIAVLASGLLILLIAVRVERPVRQLAEVAERLARGDLSARLLPFSQDEIGQITRSLNVMADRFREQLASLTREQERLGAVLEYMADGVIITDRAGEIELINPAGSRFLGTSEETALNQTLDQVSPHLRIVTLWRRCREQQREQSQVVEIEQEGAFWQVIVTPFQEADLPGYLIILQDLTRIRRLESVRRSFISNISHELRTPLAGLKVLVETLNEGALEDPPVARRFLSRMETEVDAMNQMVQELLELSRIESGQVPLSLSSMQVDAILLPPLDRLSPQAERAGLTLHVELPSDLSPVLADTKRIQQVITNLVHNAIKFTSPGGRVDVSAGEVGEEVIISVKDTGVGISPEHLERIFERFYKAERARSGSGTGLGLAIARHIVQNHRGRIWVESAEGQGSTFFFSLRVAP